MLCAFPANAKEDGAELLIAAKQGDIDVVMRLLGECEALDVNAIDHESGNTVLIYLLKKGHEQAVRLLLERGADVNYVNPQWGYNALMEAVRLGHEKIVHMLLKMNADVEYVNKFGDTAISYAMRFGRRELLELLLDHIG
jgi:ankyrin repeat protein